MFLGRKPRRLPGRYLHPGRLYKRTGTEYSGYVKNTIFFCSLGRHLGTVNKCRFGNSPYNMQRCLAETAEITPAVIDRFFVITRHRVTAERNVQLPE